MGAIDKPVRQEMIYRHLVMELGVSFEFLDEAQEAEETWGAVSLQSELLHHLLSAARNKEITRLRGPIVEMEKLGEREWAAHLSELCRKYDLEGVRLLVEQILGSIQPEYFSLSPRDRHVNGGGRREKVMAVRKKKGPRLAPRPLCVTVCPSSVARSEVR